MRWSHVAAIGLAEAATKAAAAPAPYSGLPTDHAVQGVATYAGNSANLAHEATRLVGRTWDDSKDHDFDHVEKPKHDKPSLNIPINAPITDLVHVHDLINVPVNIEDNSCDGGHCADAPVTPCETGNCPDKAPAPAPPACNGPDCGGSGWEAPAPPAPAKEDAPDVNIPINAPLTDILHVHDLLNVPVNIEDNSCDGGYCRPAGYEDCPPECLDGSCPEWPMPPTGPIVPVVPVAPAPPPKCEGEGCGAPPPAENHPAPPQEVVTPPQVIDTPPQVVDVPPKVVDTPPQVIDTPPQVVEVPPTPPKEVENHPAPPQPENPIAPPKVETPSTPPKEVTEQPAPECQGAECNPIAPPKSETPITPEAEIPTVPETPETPEVETPEIKNPETPEIPETETPEMETPETPETPEIKTPEAEIPAPPQVQNPTVPQVQTPTVPKVQVPTPTMAPGVPTPTQTSFVPVTPASKQQPSAPATPECEGEGCPPVCEGEVCEMSPPSPPVMAGSGKNVPALALGAIAALFFLL